MATQIICSWTKHLPREPHDVIDEVKFESMIETVRKGDHLPPIVVWGEEGNDNAFALCGSHRIAAYREARKRRNDAYDGTWDSSVDLGFIPVVYVTDAEMQQVADEMGYSHVSEVLDTRDYNELCWVAYRLIDSADTKAALADQI